MSAKQLTLLDLPITVANHVLEKLNLVELLTCRKVCQSLRNSIDEIETHFIGILVWVWRDRVTIDIDCMTITYSKSYLFGSNVSCSRTRRRKFLRGKNYLKIAAHDLKLLLKHANCLHIQTTSQGKNSKYFANFLVDALKDEVNNIHMETVGLIWNLPIDEIILILPFFNSQTLKYIELGGMFPAHKFERITHLDQWKKAKKFTLWRTSFDYSPIEYFLHFEEFSFNTKDFPIQNVIKIRDDLLQRCTFQKCTISVLKKKFYPVEFAKIFQPDYAGGDEFTLEYSNGKSRFEIYFGDSEFCDMWMFKIKRC